MPNYVTQMSKESGEAYLVKDAVARQQINEEVTAREAAVSAEASAREAAVSAEASARSSAIKALNNVLTTFSLSGDANINDEISDVLTWENGSVDSSGLPIESQIRIRSNIIITSSYDIVVAQPASGYKVALEEYDLHDVYIGEDTFSTSYKTLKTGRKYIILLGKTDNSNILPSDAVNISVITTNSDGNKINLNKNTIAGIIDVSNNNLSYYLIDYNAFEIATLYDNSGAPGFSHANRHRVTNILPIALKKNTRIGLNDYNNFSFYVAYGTNGTYTFTTTLSNDFILPFDSECYICIRKNGDETDISNVVDYVSKLIIQKENEIDFKKYDSQAIVMTLEPGSITSQGIETEASTDIRRRTKTAFAEKGSVLSVPEDFQEFYFEVILLGDTVSGSGWKRIYYFESDSYFRLICRKTDNSAWTDEDEIRYSQTVRFVNNPINFYKERDGENIRSICHAGLEGAPENTLPAFIEAYNAGFTIMECDSRITQDGIFVLLHDATINRTGRNIDGSTIDQEIQVKDLTYEELQNYDFGIWKGEQYRGTKIPKTEEALKLFRDLGVGVYIDMASFPYFTKEQIWSLMDVVNNAGMHDKATYIVQSGYASYIIEKDKTANFAVLGANAANWDLAASCLTGKNAVSLDAQYDTITQEKINNARIHQIPMEAWTVTDQESQEFVDAFYYLTGITGTINPAQKYYREKALNEYN